MNCRTMKIDIENIPIDELRKDLNDTIDDIRICALTLLCGIERYSGGSVKSRIEKNERIQALIDSEINHRLNM